MNRHRKGPDSIQVLGWWDVISFKDIPGHYESSTRPYFPRRFLGIDEKKSPAGWLRAKTGSLTKTNALAGIVTDASGRVLTFAFISNNAGMEGRTAIDALAGVLRTCGCGS